MKVILPWYQYTSALQSRLSGFMPGISISQCIDVFRKYKYSPLKFILATVEHAKQCYLTILWSTRNISIAILGLSWVFVRTGRIFWKHEARQCAISFMISSQQMYDIIIRHNRTCCLRWWERRLQFLWKCCSLTDLDPKRKKVLHSSAVGQKVGSILKESILGHCFYSFISYR